MPKFKSVSYITYCYWKQYLSYFFVLFQCSFKNRAINFAFLLFTQICISQTIEVNQLLIDGEKAFIENDFLLSKEIYTKATNLGLKNKDCWFNLAVSELKLEENDNACEHFYQAYLLDDGEALDIIKKNCPNLRNGSIMSVNDVEEKPKFIYKEEKDLLIEGNNLNPRYIRLLTRRLQGSRIMSKYGGSVSIQFQINNSDGLDIRKLIVRGDTNEPEIIKKEVLSILNNLVVYVSAKNKGVSVGLLEKYFFTINFVMKPY